jgi:hypothetical protein
VDALILLTVEEMAVNELREPCHHWVRTLTLPVRGDQLGDPLPHTPPAAWSGSAAKGDRKVARDIWDEVDDDVKAQVVGLQQRLTDSLRHRIGQAGKVVTEVERKRFEKRRRELERAIGDNQLARIQKDAEKLREKARQLSLFAEINVDLQRQISNLDAELALRKGHYEQVQLRLAEEEARTLKRVLPLRYTLRGEARVYPIAVEVRIPAAGGAGGTPAMNGGAGGTPAINGGAGGTPALNAGVA